jgi:hypothetical protein
MKAARPMLAVGPSTMAMSIAPFYDAPRAELVAGGPDHGKLKIRSYPRLAAFCPIAVSAIKERVEQIGRYGVSPGKERWTFA